VTGSQIHRARGFTLLEAALATVIVGVGVLAAVELFAGLTTHTRDAEHRTTALFLANNIHELLGGLSFDDPVTGSATFGPESNETLDAAVAGTTAYNDLDDFNQSFNPPIDSARNRLTQLAQYTQVVSVVSVDPNRPTLSASGTNCRRIIVSVRYRASASEPSVEVHRLSWLMTRRQ
jgi:type II secretory pathway pseudopilin PulG